MKTILQSAALSVLLCSMVVQGSDLSERTYGFEAKASKSHSLVESDGSINLPKNYRQDWVHLGTWLVDDAEAPGHGIHDVYTQPDAAQAYRAVGKFPDGAVIVKEVRKIESDTLTTGFAQWSGDVNVWFVMVKDDKRRFRDHPHWGEGWGWALFEAKNPALNVSKSYQETCIACHTPAKDNDWVYLQGYPTLK